MGYVGTTHYYLEPAIKALKKSGGILHYHETVPESLARIRPQERIEKAACALGKKVEILETHRIKKVLSWGSACGCGRTDIRIKI